MSIQTASNGLNQNNVLRTQESTLMSQLPLDISKYIFNFLDGSEVAACCSVCKEWNQIIEKVSLWKDLPFRDFLQPSLDIIDVKRTYQNSYQFNANLAKEVYSMHSLLVGDKSNIASLFFAEGKLFAGSCHGKLKVFNLETNRCIETYNGEPVRDSAPLVVDGKLFSNTSEGTIKILDLKTNKSIACLVGHTRGIASLHFADGTLFSGSYDGKIKVWDLKTNKCTATLEGHTGPVLCSIFSDGKLFTGSDDNTIKVWDLKSNACVTTLKEHEGGVSSLKFANGKLISGSSDTTIKVWDIKTNACVATLKGHKRGILSLEFANGKLFSGSLDNTIKAWDLKTNVCIATLQDHRGAVHSLLFANGKLFSGSHDNTIKVRDFTTSDKVVFKELAESFNDPSMLQTALVRFSRMPLKKRAAIYAELGKILNPKSHDSKDCAEDAFHDRNGSSSTPEQKAEAIYNYLKMRRVSNASCIMQ